MLRIITGIVLLAALAGCNGDIYLRDGVTNGDHFSVTTSAIMDPDPVTQSWIRYSLSKSVCQLGIDTDNPARATSFDCELTARRQLAEAWTEKTTLLPELEDRYLDDLARVADAGYLEEYVTDSFGERDWALPAELDMDGYRNWRRSDFRSHRPETRIVGYWSYRAQVGD